MANKSDFNFHRTWMADELLPLHGDEAITIVNCDRKVRAECRGLHSEHDHLGARSITTLGASMLRQGAVEQTPADSPTKPSHSRALRLI
jgi:hypothetical protein